LSVPVESSGGRLRSAKKSSWHIIPPERIRLDHPSYLRHPGRLYPPEFGERHGHASIEPFTSQ